MRPLHALALLVVPITVGCGLGTSGLQEVSGGGGDDGPPGVGADGSEPDDASPPGDATGPNDGGVTGSDATGDRASESGADSTSQDAVASDSPGSDVGPADVVVADVPVLTYPATCADADAGSGNQTVTLYVGGDPSKPWTADCSGGNAYLPVSSSTNFSSYPAGGCAAAQGGSVTTTWSRLRIDPSTLLVDTSDFSGATSTGDTHEVSGNGTYVHDYTSMPYGATRSCNDQQPASAGAVIDLTGTAFAVATSQTWDLAGFSNQNANNKPYGGASPASGKTVNLSVGGYPAGVSPCNDYYQSAGGACLQLAYSP